MTRMIFSAHHRYVIASNTLWTTNEPTDHERLLTRLLLIQARNRLFLRSLGAKHHGIVSGLDKR